MARINISQILMKRGNTAAAGNYIGPLGELVVDTGLKTVRVQDGVTAGGMAVLSTLTGFNQLSGNIANLQTTTANISANLSAFQTYANTTTANLGANLSAFQTYANTTFGTSNFGNSNVASYLTTSNVITGIDANVTAANLQITNLWSNAGIQSANIATLVANAGVQADAIAGANAAIITANTALKGYVDTQLSTLTNGASTALDTLLEIGTALGNNANFSAIMVTWLGNVTANTTAANTAIDTLQANLGGYYNWANANVAGLYGSITAANTAWQSNAGIQADAIVSLTANAGVQADAITSLQANITAANLAIAAASGTYSNTNVAAYLSASTTSNVGAGNLTVVNNFSTNVISANSFTYANGTSILAGIGGTYTNSNVAAYLPTYTGNIAGNIVKNGNVWTFGTDGTTTFPAGGTVTEGGGLTGAIRLTPAGGANEYQALVIYPTAAGDGDHIHLTAGGGSTELYLGNDLHYVKLVDGGNVEIRATTANLSAQAAWTFDTTGNIDTIQALGIKVPNGVPSNVAVINSTTGSWEVNPRSNLATTGGSGTGLTVDVTETGGYASTIAIATAGTGYTNGDVITVTSGTSNATFIIVIGGRNSWQFGTNGNLTLPETGYLKVGSGIVAGFASSPAPVISGFSSISAENFRFQGNGVNILSTVAGTYSNTNVAAYLTTQTFYSNANVIANLQNLTSNVVTSANVHAAYFVGNGAALTGITANGYGNIYGTTSNVTLVAGSYSYVFDNTGNLTFPTNGDIIMPGTNSILSVSGTTLLGGYSQVSGYYSILGVNYAGAGTQHGMTLQPSADNTTAINFLNASGNSVGNITQTASTVKFTGDGSGLSNVAIKTTGSWTVTTGTNTYSFTVPASGTYQMWVDCNIPNGILVWNATATITNTNVPVVGAQYAWVYNGGGTPIDFTSIPNQFVGTGNTIVRSSVSPSATTNRFDFGINNTSGASQTVRYGWIAIS
jgi:hypothetical protein